MRARSVRDKIVEAMEAIVPDVKASAADLFRQISPVYEQVPRDRAFVVERAAPQEPSEDLLGSLGATPDPYRVRWMLQVFYVQGEHVADRMLDDGDLIVDALRDLTNEAQIRSVNIVGSSDLEDANILIATYDLTVTYDRRGA